MKNYFEYGGVENEVGDVEDVFLVQDVELIWEVEKIGVVCVDGNGVVDGEKCIECCDQWRYIVFDDYDGIYEVDKGVGYDIENDCDWLGYFCQY